MKQDPLGVIDCQTFVDRADELVAGRPDMHDRSTLFAHAARCPSCRAHLSLLNSVVDELLPLAPELEPPSGFEGRVLDHLSLVSGRPIRRRTSPRGLAVAAAAAILLAVGIGGYTIGHRSVSSELSAAQAVRVGTITRADGTIAGRITLLSLPRPLALVTIDNPRPFTGVATCRLLSVDGDVTVIGTWTAEEMRTGSWSVGIDPALLASSHMEIIAADGRMAATAPLVRV
jgi:hypothetical protein